MAILKRRNKAKEEKPADETPEQKHDEAATATQKLGEVATSEHKPSAAAAPIASAATQCMRVRTTGAPAQSVV